MLSLAWLAQVLVRSVGKMADVEAWRSPLEAHRHKARSPHATPFEREPGPLARRAISSLGQAMGEAPVFGSDCESQECRLLHSAGIWEKDACGCCAQILRAQPVAKAVLWRAAPAECEFRFVIVPVQPEMDVGICVCRLQWPTWAERRQLVSSVLRDNV